MKKIHEVKNIQFSGNKMMLEIDGENQIFDLNRTLTSFGDNWRNYMILIKMKMGTAFCHNILKSKESACPFFRECKGFEKWTC